MKSLRISVTTTLVAACFLLDGVPGLAGGVPPTSPALAATSTQIFPSWERGYFNEQGTFVAGAPSWGSFTEDGGSFLPSANSTNSLVFRWVSNFTGQVNLSTAFTADPGSNITAVLKAGNNIITIPIITIPSQNPTNKVAGGVNLGLVDVKAGEAIDIVFTPGASSQGGKLTFQSSMSVPAGLSIIERNKLVLNPYAPGDLQPGDIVTSSFNARVKQFSPTDVARVRSGPSLSSPVQTTYASGTNINFDAWTIGDLVQASYGNGDRWYRIANTNLWMSEAVLDGSPPALPLPPPSTVSVRTTQVGMTLDKVYEAVSGYITGRYQDVLGGPPKDIVTKATVQAQNSLGTFIGQAIGSTLPYWYMPLEDQYALKILSEAQALLNSPYLFPPNCRTLVNCFLTPEQHKGENSTKSFSMVGFIEALAERAGISAGEGFIPASLESTIIHYIGIVSSTGLSMFSPQSLPNSTSISPLSISPLFTPEGFKVHMQGSNYASSDRWLYGWIEASDFLLTDPDGFQFGFRNGQKIEGIRGASMWESEFLKDSPSGIPSLPDLLNSGDIPSSNVAPTQCKSPDPYHPVENLFQFMIPKRKPGQYILQLFGQSENSKALVSTALGSAILYPDCKGLTLPTNPTTVVIDDPGNISAVPEPSSIMGLITFVVSGVWLKRRQKSISRSN